MSENETNGNDEFVNEETCDLIVERYIQIAAELCAKLKISPEQIVISEENLAGALEEFKLDIEILKLRRQHDDLSTGKIAGVLTFRLARWHIISFMEEVSNHVYSSKLGYLVALGVSMKHILNLDISGIEKSIRQELSYTLARRHTNQETLGLCFDVLEKYPKTSPKP